MCLAWLILTHSLTHLCIIPLLIGKLTQVDSHNRTVLTYYGLMLSGAVARSAAATAVHPLNVIKTMLQTKEGNSLLTHSRIHSLTYECNR